jgi:hypothetical protein
VLGVTHCMPKCCYIMHSSVSVLVTPIKEVEGGRGLGSLSQLHW